MKVLVTGGAGYVGSVLVPKLVEQGVDVIVVDLGIFGWKGLEGIIGRSNLQIVFGSICAPRPEWFDGVDVVINLAGLSNDPMANFSPYFNYAYNASGTAMTALFAKKSGVKAFVQASSASVYGVDDRDERQEHDVAKCEYPYGLSKLMAEAALLGLADDGFRVVCLRKGTLGGPSPRMRFDLLVNTMVAWAVDRREIRIMTAPDTWRPIMDVRDAAAVYVQSALDDRWEGVYNIAERNVQIEEVARIVKGRLGEKWGITCEIVKGDNNRVRSYRLATNRMRAMGFEPQFGVEDTVDGIMGVIPKNPFDGQYHNIQVWQSWVTKEAPDVVHHGAKGS